MQFKIEILLLFSLILAHLAESTTVCRDEAFGRRICSLDSNPEITKIVNGKVFVGVANALHVFQPDLRDYEDLDLSSDQETVRSCKTLGISAEDCKNFIRTIQVDPFDSNKVLVCGTNAYSPLCNVHQVSDVSNYYNLSSSGENDAGYSPHSNTFGIVSLLASNGRFFSATSFSRFSFQTAIKRSLDPLNGMTSFDLTTPFDNKWLDQPNVVSVHEHGDYIYFFLTESALEVSTIQETRYSRAIRICKTDDGFGGSDRFLTFQKARITCAVRDGIPFFYDDLESTFLYESADGTAVLYGVFNAQNNGPPGGAVCKFVFDASADEGIIDIFNSKEYLVQDINNVETFTSAIGTSFGCPGTGGPQRPSAEAEYLLKSDPILQSGSDELPLFVSQSEFLDKLTAETVQYRGEAQEIIYFSTKLGDIKQVILSNVTAGHHVHTVYKSEGSSSQVKDLILHHESSNERNLIAGIGNAIVHIPRGKCSSYASCFSCFDSRDAYCGWDTISKSCKNKLANPDLSTLIQSFSASESVITAQCGSRPPTPAITDSIPNTPCSPKATTAPRNVDVTSNADEGGDDCTTKDVIINPSGSEGLAVGGSGGLSVAAVIGAAIGAFIIGVPVGGLVCVLFYSKFVNRNTDKKDSAPETPTEMTVVVSTDGTAPKINNQTLVTPESNKDDEHAVKKDLLKPTLKPAPPPRYTPHKPPSLNQPNGVKPPHAVMPLHAPPPAIKVPSEYETPTTKSNGKLSGTTSLPALKHTTSSNNRAMTLNREQQQPPLPEENEDNDNAFTDNDTLPPLRDFHHHAGTMHGSLPRMKTRSNGVARKQVPGYKTPRGRTDSTTWLRQRSESLSSDISSNTSPLQSPISDV